MFFRCWWLERRPVPVPTVRPPSLYLRPHGANGDTMTTSPRPFDRAADHTAATARRLRAEIGWRRVTVSLEDREAVVRFMTADVA